MVTNNILYKIHLKRTGSSSSERAVPLHDTTLFRQKKIFFWMKFVNDIFCYHFQFYNSIISLLIAENIVWCRFLKHRFCKTYFNAVWLAQIHTLNSTSQYFIFNVEGKVKNLPPIKLHWNNSYKTYFIKIDILTYYWG